VLIRSAVLFELAIQGLAVDTQEVCGLFFLALSELQGLLILSSVGGSFPGGLHA
jgi:hypothetical protein